jgi:ATP-dependent DNA helicase RecG
MEYLETHETIKNKEARAITHIRADYQMKAVFGRMVKSGMIEQVPNTRTNSTAYRRVKRQLAAPNRKAAPVEPREPE